MSSPFQGEYLYDSSPPDAPEWSRLTLLVSFRTPSKQSIRHELTLTRLLVDLPKRWIRRRLYNILRSFRNSRNDGCFPRQTYRRMRSRFPSRFIDWFSLTRRISCRSWWSQVCYQDRDLVRIERWIQGGGFRNFYAMRSWSLTGVSCIDRSFTMAAFVSTSLICVSLGVSTRIAFRFDATSRVRKGIDLWYLRPVTLPIRTV
jgi:hypothetical protein